MTYNTVRDCVASALDDRDGDFTVLSTRTKVAKGLAAKVIAAVSSESGEKALHTFESALLRRLHDIVESSASCAKFSGRKKKLWSEFHTIRSTELKEMWCMFLQSISIEEEDPLLMQYVFEKMFNNVLQTQFCDSSSAHDPAVAELTVNEHNALRYAAGYVPRSLAVKISRGSHPYKESYLQCLSNMGEKGKCPGDAENIQAFTKQWLSAVNRGGLVVVSDEVYLFFSEMEMKMRKHLLELISKKHINKSAVIEEVASDDDVLFHWCLISTGIDDEAASQELLGKIVELWLTIRGFSTAGAYIEYYKQCRATGVKKSTGLRRGLKRKCAEVEQ